MSNLPPPSSPPSSLKPAPVDSGSGKYLIVLLLLGGGAAGLFFWRRSQADDPTPPPVAPVAAPVVPARPPPPNDDIPPPPPIPDSGPDTGTPKAPAAGWGDGCAQTSCSGRVTAELSGALSFRAKTAHKCYDEALAQDPTLKGGVTINVKVSGNGTVCGASVASSDLANGGVAPCIANRFRQGARLPSPAGGCVEVNVPMKLLPPH
jgi:hypothetical protein